MNTIDNIAKILYSAQIPYHYDQQQGFLGLMFTLKNGEQIPFSVQIREGGKWLDVSALNFLCVKESVFKGVVFQSLLTIQWDTSIVRYFYNPHTGNIGASVDIPLIDITLTYNNFLHYLTILLNSLDETIPRLRTILATGNDPGRKSQLEQVIQEMPEDTLEQIAKLIELRQQQKK